MKKEKQQYDLDKQIGTMSRVTQDELYVDFQKDGKYYKEFEISEFREEPRKRLNNDTLFNRKD